MYLQKCTAYKLTENDRALTLEGFGYKLWVKNMLYYKQTFISFYVLNQNRISLRINVCT